MIGSIKVQSDTNRMVKVVLLRVVHDRYPVGSRPLSDRFTVVIRPAHDRGSPQGSASRAARTVLVNRKRAVPAWTVGGASGGTWGNKPGNYFLLSGKMYSFALELEMY